MSRLRRSLVVLCIVAVLTATPFLASLAEGPTYSGRPNPNSTVQPCTSVAVEMVDAVDSARAKPGDFFRFQTMEPTNDGGTRVVIPAHTVGYGVVSLVIPAAKQGRSGALLLEPLYLKMPDGSQLGVVLDHGNPDLEKQGKGGDLIPGYLGLIPVPGVGVAVSAANFFHHGKDITIQKGTQFSIFPQNDPKSAFCQPD